jgi:hypothetical protein
MNKLITACMALVAFAALAVGPATASAANDPQLTDNAGKMVGAGTLFLGTQVNSMLIKDTSNNAIVTCTAGEVTGTVVKNAMSTVEANITASGFGGAGEKQATEPNPECTGIVSAGFTGEKWGDWCLRSTPAMADDEFQMRGEECAKAATNLKFILATTTIKDCEYEATGVLKGTYKTHPTDALLTFAPTSSTTGFKRVGASSMFCPASATLELTLTLEKDAGTAEPFFIS